MSDMYMNGFLIGTLSPLPAKTFESLGDNGHVKQSKWLATSPWRRDSLETYDYGAARLWLEIVGEVALARQRRENVNV